mgnify:CR=1 FL=1
MSRKRSHPIWSMRPGEVRHIALSDYVEWKVASYRVARATTFCFKFEKFLDVCYNVECYEKRLPALSPEAERLDGLEVFGTLSVSGLVRSGYENAVAQIERRSDKRFIIEHRGENGLHTVTRIPDLAEKRAYRTPKSKYGFGDIAVGSHKKYNQTSNWKRIENAAYDYTRRSGGRFRFEVKCYGDHLYVFRVG